MELMPVSSLPLHLKSRPRRYFKSFAIFPGQKPIRFIIVDEAFRFIVDIQATSQKKGRFF
jgi:hypothetical protein